MFFPFRHQPRKVAQDLKKLTGGGGGEDEEEDTFCFNKTFPGFNDFHFQKGMRSHPSPSDGPDLQTFDIYVRIYIDHTKYMWKNHLRMEHTLSRCETFPTCYDY